MRAPVSVVMPLFAPKQPPARLTNCLRALAEEGLAQNLLREVIISDGGSDPALLQQLRATGANILATSPSRGRQLRHGCAQAQGDWLLVLHCDTVLETGWSAHVQHHITHHPYHAAAFRLRFDQTHLPARLTAGWANLRSAAFGLPFGDQGLLLPRKLYTEAGGYPDQPLMEDIAIARALPHPPRLMPCYAQTSAARYQQEGWLKRGSRNLWLQARYACGASPETLDKAYRR